MLSHPSDSLDYFYLIKEARALSSEPKGQSLKIAVFGDCATQQLTAISRALLARHQFSAQIFESEFNTLTLETLNPDSAYYTFDPAVTWIISATAALFARYHAPETETNGFADRIVAEMTQGWDRIHERHPRTSILQTNFVLPVERYYGNLDAKMPGSWRPSVSRINAALADAARVRPYMHLVDLEHTASLVGKRVWFDERLWILSKSLCALDVLPLAVKSLVDTTLALQGRIVKCVVTDLDNTMWGGVIGDDGLEGIRLGDVGDGPAFTRYQQFLLALKKRGILLAVCSKNDPENARLPFLKHPEMVLKEEDFAVFVANWNNKADNLRFIRETLNVGLDSIVFVDDSAFERNLIRQELPDVIVPEMPEDPAEYVRILAELNLFEVSAVSEEDALRTDMIRTEAKRRELQVEFRDVPEYLRSLEMRYRLERFDVFSLPRIAQLIARSNQFNLTTRRYSEQECGEMMRDTQRFLPVYFELKDRFGDSGLISVAVFETVGDTLEISAWLMSCRVLLRGVEETLMNFVFLAAAERGLQWVRGTYIPTAKNKMVEDFYARFGFRTAGTGPDGSTRWELAVSEYKPKKAWMTREREASAEPSAPPLRS